jgi:mono/diheme cytochrome c family protein
MSPTNTRSLLTKALTSVAIIALTAVIGVQLLGSATAQNVPPATKPLPSAQPVSAPMGANATTDDRKKMLVQYCSGCHNDKMKTANMSVLPLDAANLDAHNPTWEKILRRVELGEMPPRGMKRPSKEQLADFTHWLEESLDKMGAAAPNPGRATLRRMNRAEYANAVRDLLALEVDMSKDLPVDDTGYGFDNIADILTVSPTLMDRYMNTAGKVARLATGQTSHRVITTDYKLTRDLFENAFGVPAYNERASDDLPLDSRGGGAFKFYAPHDATYAIQIYLNSGTQTENEIDAYNRYEVKVPLKAGLRTIGASFRKQLALDESLLPKTTTGPRPTKPTGPAEKLPMDVWVDGGRVQTISVPSYANGPAMQQNFYLRDVMQISVAGPYDVAGPGDTPSRRKVFICRPANAGQENACATRILTALTRQAYRRPVTSADIKPLMKLYAEGRQGSDFDHGISAALEGLLVSPSFLFMRERDPAGSKPGTVHRITDLELASRLSLFLWSSIPDEQLLQVAEKKQLSKPAILKQQIARMLNDPKAKALTTNFAGQWLYLRKLEHQRPDRRVFPNFDQRLRAAMLTETEMFFDGVVKENRSVVDFLDADYTYLNQRLAEHYKVPGVYGTTFRKVKLDPAKRHGGLLNQASILTVTSYNNRTSVVLRGKWILENILAAPPPPPPPDVPDLGSTTKGKALTIREQMQAHATNAVCASCHTKMDPFGFSLENYDAIGGWRDKDAGRLLDVSAVLPDGTKFEGPAGLQNVLLSRKDQFVEAFTERLMTYALGRGVEAYDMPAVRIVRDTAKENDYRMQSIILAIVQSTPFAMRRTPEK